MLRSQNSSRPGTGSAMGRAGFRQIYQIMFPVLTQRLKRACPTVPTGHIHASTALPGCYTTSRLGAKPSCNFPDPTLQMHVGLKANVAPWGLSLACVPRCPLRVPADLLERPAVLGSPPYHCQHPLHCVFVFCFFSVI